MHLLSEERLGRHDAIRQKDWRQNEKKMEKRCKNDARMMHVAYKIAV